MFTTLNTWGASLTRLIDPASLSGALLYLALFVTLAVVANRALRTFVKLSLKRDIHNHIDRTALGFLKQLGSIFIWVVALVLYAHLIPPLRTLGTALLTGVSVVSIVIGLAAQNTLGNLVAGLALLIYRPFKVGDRVQVTAPTGLETGTVESISLGYTILQTFDNRRVVLSNSTVANETTVNLSSVDPKVMALVPISIGYNADIDRARALVLELARQHPDASEIVGCPVVALGASSVDLSLRVWCSDAGTAFTFKTAMLEQVKKRFDQEGIEIPYAYSNVILKPTPEPGQEKA